VVGVGVNDVPIVGEPVAYGIGFAILLLVLLTAEWAGSLVTVAHEGGHMLMAALTFRGHSGFKLTDGGGGGTEIDDPSWGVGDYLITFAGYATPPALGVGGAALIANDRAWSVLWVGLVFLLLAFVFARNALANAVTLLALAGVAAAALFGGVELQAAVAVALVWWLLIGGVRSAWTMSTSDGSDSYWLARRTLIPRVAWKVLWIFIAVVALIIGGQLLLRPGYEVG
jgi:hypothetical protein